MIERMKKISVLSLDSKREKTVAELRDLGVIHVQLEDIHSESVETLLHHRARIDRAILALPSEETGVEEEDQALTSLTVEEGLAEAESIADLLEERRQIEETLERLSREAARLEPWGDFDVDLVRELAEAGIVVRFHLVGDKEMRNLPGDRLFVINRTSTLVYLVSIRREGEQAPQIDAMPTPERSASELRGEVAELRRRQDALEIALMEKARSRKALENVLEDIDAQIEFDRVHDGMDRMEQVVVLTGFVPDGDVTTFRKEAADRGWGVLVREPGPEDSVPTKVKNPKPVRIIQPVFNLMGTTPGYHERDISFWFLLFFSVFFAMIIGDGGYGLVLVGLSVPAVVGSLKKTGAVSEGVLLLTVLSIATVAWGAVTGTWFGYEPLAELPVLSSLVVPELSSFNPRSTEVIQRLCFILGTVQLTIAHVWNFVDEVRSKAGIRSLTQIGWLVMVLGLYHLVLNVVLGQAMVDYALYLIIGGFGTVILFSSQEPGQNFFVGIGKGFAGLITTALDGVSAFSDIISYIRLFAVGLASVEIAKSFNSMAEGMMDGVGGIIAGILVLLLGHTLNLVMGALSVVVHGVRLNMLEFSGHLGMEWTGTPYRPFGKRAAS
ncbi:MAG: V-type ATP synthase subunit I [Spirochaetaceae bacterium]